MSSLFSPITLGPVTLPNRIVIAPMCQYTAEDGLPTDWHLIHLGHMAFSGAGALIIEATAVEDIGRITPGCLGLWSDATEAALDRVIKSVRTYATPMPIMIQLGHAGRKASSRRPWEGGSLLLPEDGGWRPIGPSAVPQLPDEPAPVEMTRADMDEIKEQFVYGAQMAADIGADWLELHCAHGYLLSSFISPLTNHRDDEYGGSLENRLRYPLEIFRAVRAVWPEDRPMSVRISAHDWVPGGITPDDAVEIAKAFKAAGADLIDCSSGQVSKQEKPVYGRMFQTPFADRIRQEAGIATMAVGAISEADHANSIIAAGRADLCAVARPHLANPNWTLTEAAKIGYTPIAWPKQLYQGKRQMESLFEREKAQQAAAGGH